MKPYCVTIKMMSDPLQILLPSVLKARTCLCINGISKIMVQFCTIFKHWNCFPCSVTTDGKDGNGLKLANVTATFQVSMPAMPAIITRKLLWLVFPDKICLISSP